VEELEVGGTLHSRLRSGGGAAVSMSTREAVRVGLDVARALSFAHAAGVTHNDVKSDNILFKNEGNTAVLADFGLARRVRSALRSTFDARLSSTGGGAGLLGTYTYCAPENMDEQSAGYGQPPGDVFSLGVLLYEMSSGLVPWEGTSMVRVLDSVRAGVRPEFFFDVDSRLRALVERCWAQEAQARPTAQEVVVALAALEAEVG
jgi:serine/threonine protein kinase